MLAAVTLQVAAGGQPAALVGAPGFEPRTSCSQSTRATKLRHAPSAVILTGPGPHGETNPPWVHSTVGAAADVVLGRR
jgi:hypothetical protein